MRADGWPLDEVFEAAVEASGQLQQLDVGAEFIFVAHQRTPLPAVPTADLM